MENKTKHKIKTIFADIIVIILGLSYIFYRVLTLELKELDPIIVTFDGVFCIAVGVSIKQVLSEIGLIKGYETNEYKEEDEKHKNACNESIEFIDKVDRYEEEEIANRKLKYRKAQLQSARLKYDYFFTEDGEIKDVIITPLYKVKKKLKKKLYEPAENEFVLDRYQRKVLKKCYKVKIKILNLFSEYSKDTSNFSDRETTDKEQRTKTLGKNLLTAMVFALADIYIVARFVEFDVGAVIFATVQVCGFIAIGLIQMYQNINFVRVDKVNTLKEKNKRLVIFINNCKKGKYEDERMVEKEHI